MSQSRIIVAVTQFRNVSLCYANVRNVHGRADIFNVDYQ